MEVLKMKKLISGLFVFVSAFVLASAVFAANQNDNKDWKQMLPMMKQMHPNFLEEQLQKMYEQCRSNGNRMMEHMMKHDIMNQQMMKKGHMNKHMM
jgi:cytochrome c553